MNLFNTNLHAWKMHGSIYIYMALFQETGSSLMFSMWLVLCSNELPSTYPVLFPVMLVFDGNGQSNKLIPTKNLQADKSAINILPI